MKKLMIVLLGLSLVFFSQKALVIDAIETVNDPVILIEEEAEMTEVIVMPLEKEDITEPLDEPAKGRLEAALDSQELKPVSIDNFLKHAIRVAISRGAPTNTIVLVLLLPLVGIIVSALYYLVGLTGFGVFMPAMIAVSFLATGVIGGLALFGTTLIFTLLTVKLLKKVKLHLRSRRTIILWVVSLATFGFLFLAPAFNLVDLTRISIFPILFMTLLSQEFVRFQRGKSKKEAIRMTIGTLITSIVGATVMGWQWLQELILLNPEVSSLLILLVAFIVGRYSGFRLLEYRRFKSVLRK